MLRGSNSEQVEHSQELVLSHVAILGDIVVLEYWLEMNALVFDCYAILFQDVIDFS